MIIKREQVSGNRLQGVLKKIFAFSLNPKPHTLHPDEKGFTILLAALVGSLVLTLGISIFSIAQKQLILSSLGRSSQYAFYAADTAAECALFWDTRYSMFSSSTAEGVVPKCDTVEIRPDPLFVDIPDNPPYTVTFELRNLFQSPTYEGNCAIVEIEKRIDNPKTVIKADGFSVPCEEVESSSRALQRSVELTY